MSRQLVYLVDDDTPFVESLQWVLEEHDYHVAAFTDFKIALPLLQEASPEEPACLLLDVRMPNIGGVEAFDKLKKEGVDLPVIFLTGHGDVALAVEVMSRGALSFLEKPVNHEQLLETLTLAFSPDIQCRRQTIDDRLLAEKRARLIKALSLREAEVLNGVVQGLTAKVLSEKLGVSQKTIEYHRAKLLNKLKVKNIAQLQRVVALHTSESSVKRGVDV